MTYRLAVFGNPVAHSRSPEIHLQFGAQLGVDLAYDKVLVPAGEFDEVAHDFRRRGGHGFNITVPNKGDAYRFVTSLTPDARECEAVNTIWFDGGEIMGDSTDGAGLNRDLRNQGWAITGQRVLVLGAGGAVRSVLPGLLREAPAALDLCNRTPGRAAELVERYGSLIAASVPRVVEAGSTVAPYDLVINGTSAGLGGELPACPVGALATNTRVYDMIYGAGDTHFVAWARTCGVASAVDGLGMLVEQAAVAFARWFPKAVTARAIDTAPVIASLRTALAR